MTWEGDKSALVISVNDKLNNSQKLSQLNANTYLKMCLPIISFSFYQTICSYKLNNRSGMQNNRAKGWNNNTAVLFIHLKISAKITKYIQEYWITDYKLLTEALIGQNNMT